MVENIWTLSTAHMPSTSPVFHNHQVTPPINPRVIEHDYGYLVCIYPSVEKYCAAWLLPVVKKALENNCVMINFDRDADVDSSFRTYDWQHMEHIQVIVYKGEKAFADMQEALVSYFG